MTKAESEQLARALQEEQYFELSQENKKAGARHKQEILEKDAIISRVSMTCTSPPHSLGAVLFAGAVASCHISAASSNCAQHFPQLEESNKTLTKDAENLSKDKTELNDKLLAQEQGNVHLFNILFVVNDIFCTSYVSLSLQSI